MKLPKKLAAALRRIGLNDLRAKIEGENYLDNRRRLFNRDIEPLIRNVSFSDNSQRIIIWSPFAAWYHSLPEYFISTNLRLRGHEVIHALCNGSPPHCAMDRKAFVRPPCESCSMHSEYLVSIFKAPIQKLTEFVPQSEQNNIANECLSMGMHQIKEYKYLSIPLGEHSIRYLTTYSGGFVDAESNLLTIQKILAGEIISTLYAYRLHKQINPTCVLMYSGNDAQHFGPFRVLRELGANVITWDESAQWRDGFYFARNSCAGSVPLDGIWDEEKNLLLADHEKKSAKEYVNQWKNGKVCGTIYHPMPNSNKQEIINKYRLDAAHSTFLAVPNVVWDSNVISRNVGFKDMRHWVKTLIEWFIDNPNKKLLIRAHPAEKRVVLKKHFTREDSTLPALISKMFANQLPDNIIVIPADDDVDTYELGQLCDGVCAYTSNIALELALRGKKTWIAGKSFYRGMGFTTDIASPVHLTSLLERGGWRENLNTNEMDLAVKFLYLWVFRYATRIPWHAREIGTFSYPKVHFKDFKFLIPGRDAQLDAICDRILDGRPFLDIPRTTTARFWKTQELN